MSDLFKTYVINNDANIFLNAAELMRWEITIPYGKETNLAFIKKGGLNYQILKGSLSVNTTVATSISGNKYLSNTILNHFTEYVTHPHLFDISLLTNKDIKLLLEKYSMVVVKPMDANNGIGITTSLTTVAEVQSAVAKIAELGNTYVLIENHVHNSNEYRVLLWKGEVIDILHRIPAHIVGNNSSTIKELINEKNARRFEKFKTLFNPIKFDETLVLLLKNANLSYESVLQDKEYKTINKTCNLSLGGETKRIESTIHPAYIELFKQVYEATTLNYCGVDIITPDLVSEPEIGKTAINELNGAPGFHSVLFADIVNNTPFYGTRKLLQAIEENPA